MKNEVMSQLLVGCIQCKMSHFWAQQLTLLRNPHIEQTNNTQLIEWEGAIIIIKANKEWSNEYTNAYNDDPKNDEHELSPYEMFFI